MATPDELLGNMLSSFGNNNLLPMSTVGDAKKETVSTLGENKKQLVSQASESKKGAMGRQLPSDYEMAVGALFGNGDRQMGQLEADIRTADTADLYRNYSDEQARQLNLNRAFAAGQVLTDNTRERTNDSSVFYDDATSIGLGAANALGGIAALGTGLVNNEAGTAVAGALNNFNEFVRGTQSETLEGRRRILEAKNTLDTRDSTVEAEGQSGFMSSLQRIGKDVISSIDNATDDEDTFVEGTLQALGSLLAVPVVGRGVSALVPASTSRGIGLAAEINTAVGTTGAANLLAAAGRAAPTMASIGLIEGGGAYQQVTADVMSRDFDTLNEESPMFRELIAEGVSPEEARIQVASRTGLMSAGITAPLAALTGSIAGRFESAPTARQGISQMVNALLREPLEEGLQGGISQTAQNYAEQVVANENQELAEGVGRQIGEGAIYGLGMTAAIQSPNAAREAGRYAGMGASTVARATAAGLGVVGEAANNALAKRAAEVDSANNAASPVSDDVVRQAAVDIQASAPVAQETVNEAIQAMDATPEVKEQASAYATNLIQANNFDPVEIMSASTPPEVLSSVEGVTNRVEAIQRLADVVASSPEGSRAQMGAGFALHSLLLPYENIINSDPAAMESLSSDSPAASIIAEFNAMADKVQSTPKVMAALQTVNAAIERMSANQAEITTESLNTPETQTQVSDAIKVAEIAPEKGNLETNQQILFQIQQGTLQVTPEQKAALDTSVALLRAVQASDAEAVRLGRANKVSLNITSEDGAKGKSVTQHAQGIMAAYKAGNTNLAAARLFHLREFAQNMQNKVEALNTHYAGGNPSAPGISYQALSPSLEWYDSPETMSVAPGKPNSVLFAQQVNGEAKLLADVYNGLVTAFPDLGLQVIQGSSLVPELNQPVRDVVAAYRLAQSQAAQPAPVQEPTPTPEPVVEAPTVSAEAIERVSRMTDGQLNDRLHRTDINDPLYDVLDAEMSRREDVAQAANEAAELAEQETVVEEPDTVTPVEEETIPQGIRALYPDLAGAVNYLEEAFVIPEQQRTRTIGSESPLAVVEDGLTSSAAFSNLLGRSLTKEFSPETASAYSDYLQQVEPVKRALNKRLQNFLGEKYKGNETIGEAFLRGERINTFVRGKALNIVDVENGNFSYNQELIESAVLASMQWLLTADELGAILDTQDVSEITGVPEILVSDELLQTLNEGLSITEAKRTLATKIRNYWGMDNNVDGSIGFQEGIPEAIAAELITVLVEGKALTRNDIRITEADGLPPLENGKENVKDFVTLSPMVLDAKHPMRAYPTAIEEAVMLEPEEDTYIGDSRPPVARTQLRNPLVENTPEQIQAIENEQNTPYYTDTLMVNMYQALGVDNLVEMFGAGDFNPDLMNKNHAQSLEGLNRSIIASYNHLIGTVDKISNSASEMGIEQTPIRYGMNVTRVGRLQMLGKYNPQASKLVREAIMATRSTLDLSNQGTDDYRRFMQGVAQALGIKSHKMSVEAAVAKAQDYLDGDLASIVEETISVISSGNQGELSTLEMPSTYAKTVKDAFANAGVDMTPASLHAMIEYSRWKSSPSNAFTTSLYLEADGITNGPMNAMVLFTFGGFTPNQIKNYAKGGLFFNRGAETANNNNEFVDKKDLYQATTDSLSEIIKQNRFSLSSNNPEAATQMNELLGIMDLFFGKDLSFDGETLTLERGITKNPLTITLYGSGEAGIAGKLVKTLTDALYERMSQMSVAMNNNPELSMAEAMFGPQSVDEADAKAKMAKFNKAMDALTHNKAVLVKGEIRIESDKDMAGKKYFSGANPQEFSLSVPAIRNLQSNMHRLFVSPMREAIVDVVGDPLMESADLIRKATQVQSIVLEHAFRKEIEEELAKKANNPSWVKTSFLTRRDMDNIYKRLDHLSPRVETGTQSFYIAASQSTDIGVSEFARSFSDAYSTKAYIYGPSDAGVAGTPFLTIGTGDGQTMQNISVDPNAPTGTTKIFDGIHLPLDQIESGSVVANKAVYDSWVRNPMADLHKSYSAFMNDADLTNMDKPLRKALTRALLPPQFWTKDVPASELRAIMQNMVSDLNEKQQSVEARHRVMARVQVSVDQMAAGASPYFRQGDVVLAGTSPEAIAEQLNELYTIELASIIEEESQKTYLKQDIIDVGVKTASGAVVMDQASLRQLGNKVNIPVNQRDVFNRIMDGLATQDYQVVFGSAEQLSNYARDNGLNGLQGVSLPNGQISGYTTFGDKTVYLINPTSETLVHELIHAATYGNVLAHYEGTATPEVSGAVARIEVLMNQFLAIENDLTQLNPQVAQSYVNAVNAIRNQRQDSVGKASSINEFMAWVLSNEDLGRVASRTEASKLARIAGALMDVLRAMFRIAKRPGKDILSNLQFNSAIIISSEPSTSTRLDDSVSFQNSVFGDNDRLTTVMETYSQVIGRYMEQPLQAGVVNPSVSVSDAIMNAYAVANSFQVHGFKMNMQESSAFNHIVTALATEAQLDPNTMVQAQKIYAEVMKNLSVESFMENPDSTNPADRYYAQEKYDVLVGKYTTRTDSKGRSSLVPAFLALATVHDGFRSILADMDMPKSIKSTADGVDGLLENLGTKAMDSLSAKMSGTTKSKTITEGIDALNKHLSDLVQQRESFIDQAASTAGGIVDRANELVIEGVDKLSAALMDNATRVQKNSSNRLLRLTANFGAGIAAVVSETTGQHVSQGVMSAMNRMNVWRPFHDFVNDVVGRTESNANVYDMIKGVRAMVQQARQQFRIHLPALIQKQFSVKLRDDQWSSLTKSLAKTDIASLFTSYTQDQVIDLVLDSKALSAEINTLEQAIRQVDPTHFTRIQKKMQQLAMYMNTGKTSTNLLRNAYAVANLAGENRGNQWTTKDDNFVNQVDNLITLYSINTLNTVDKDTLVELAKGEKEGIKFVMSYLDGQRQEELRKTSGKGRVNGYKGYVPTEVAEGISIIVADDSEYAKLVSKSYVRVADYGGSSLDRRHPKGYYRAPVSTRAGFEQGIMQNVHMTASGVDATTGYSSAQTAGRITEPSLVQQISKAVANGQERARENLLPVFDESFNVIAYERGLDATIMEEAIGDTGLANVIGQWRGRQVEEAKAQFFNERLVDALKDMYDADAKEGRTDEYVDLFSDTVDPVIKDALALMTRDTAAYVRNVFKDQFMVRKDMLNDALGYRSASIGDAWTGNSRWSPKTQEAVRNLAKTVFGNKAYQNLVNAEKTIQSVVTDAKVLIVVKSVVVPVVNLMSNVYQLISRGVPLTSIVKSFPKKTAEIDAYVNSRVRLIEAEAELRAATGNLREQRRLEAEIQTITDGHKRLSIWPLIEAGEFSSISDLDVKKSDVLITSGRLQAYIEEKVNMLPTPVANLGRYALITRDTALFQGLQKTVEYGDFLAKAMLYDDLVVRQKRSKKYALGRVTEEFVNYDRLAGRFRGYLESMGLLWFYNFKIRSAKIAMSMIRNNPVHTLLATLAPAPTFFGTVGLPTEDNVFSKLADGSLDYSIGPGQGLNSINLNPWVNLSQ